MNSDGPQSVTVSTETHVDGMLPSDFPAFRGVGIVARPQRPRRPRLKGNGPAKTGGLGSGTPRMRQPSSGNLSIVVQLVEAACKARDGDREATKAHIAHAVALLRGKPDLGPGVSPEHSNPESHIERGGLPAWQMRSVFAHVEANLCRRVPIAELSGLVGLSPSHFCRAFKSTCGVSPRDYVLRRRVEAAQGLMLTTAEPLSAIAISCGMCDQSHFTRSFHRIVGETPYTWRRTRRGALKLD
jgi:AraC family transcriptional regulator